MTKTNKKHITFFSILELIVDIIVYPVIIISFMSSFFMLVAKSKNVITPIFGYTFVRVLSNSMSIYCPEAERNFIKGDIAVIKTQDSLYSIGDIIAFYNYSDSVDSTISKMNVTNVHQEQQERLDGEGNVVYDDEGNVEYVTNNYVPTKDDDGNVIFDQQLIENVKNAEVGETIEGTNYVKTNVPDNRHSRSDVEDMGTVSVYFHQIVQIRIDTSGTIFYITKGTTNSSTEIVREDFVAGKYVSTGRWLTSLVSFCASTEGMIILVVAPISFVVLIELLSILEQINNILLEKRVLAREIPFDGKDCKKANICPEMRDVDKIFYYDVMSPEYKAEVFENIWGYLKDSKKTKDKKLFETALDAAMVYSMENPSQYYEVWINSTQSKKRQQQIISIEQKAERVKYDEVACVEYRNVKKKKTKRKKAKSLTEIDKTIEKIKKQELEDNNKSDEIKKDKKDGK